MSYNREHAILVTSWDEDLVRSEAAGGWIGWDDNGGRRLIPLDEWKAEFERLTQGRES